RAPLRRRGRRSGEGRRPRGGPPDPEPASHLRSRDRPLDRDDRRMTDSPTTTGRIQPGRKPRDHRGRAARPHAPQFPHAGPNHLQARPEASVERTRVGRTAALIRSKLFGRPLSIYEEIGERLGVLTGLAVFASDNISSSAYATEEIMRVLVLAGAGA